MRASRTISILMRFLALGFLDRIRVWRQAGGMFLSCCRKTAG